MGLKSIRWGPRFTGPPDLSTQADADALTLSIHPPQQQPTFTRSPTIAPLQQTADCIREICPPSSKIWPLPQQIAPPGWLFPESHSNPFKVNSGHYSHSVTVVLQKAWTEFYCLNPATQVCFFSSAHQFQLASQTRCTNEIIREQRYSDKMKEKRLIC